MPRSVLVTGGGGLVGAWAARALEARGDRAVTPSRAEADVRSPADVARVLAGCDAVLHFAAQSVVGEAVRDPVATYEANVAGTWTVLEACRRAGVGAVVASSDRVYGDVAGAVTEAAPLAPVDPYGASKAAAELVALAFPGVPVAVTRMAHVYGSGDRRRSRLVPEVVAAARAGRAPRIHSDGTPAYDFVHAADAAAAHLALLDALGEVAGEAFNVGSGEAHSVRSLVDLALELAESDVPATYGSTPGAAAAWLDTAKLRAATGWAPRLALREGLREALGA